MRCNSFNFEESTCTQVNIGFDYSKQLRFTDINGDAIDITGVVLVGEIKDSLGGNSLLSLPIVGNDQTTGLYIPDPNNGIVFLQIKKEDNLMIPSGYYPYEITITQTNGDMFVWMQGNIKFFDRDF